MTQHSKMPEGVEMSGHEVLAAVLRLYRGAVQVLAWQRALDPDRGRWALPGGSLRGDENVASSMRRQLAEKVDVRDVSHIEQLSVFSEPNRIPGVRVVAAAFLGLVRTDSTPAIPNDTAWHDVAALPPMAFDHAEIVHAAHERLSAKLSYTNVGFALAPEQFTISTLREIYAGALGHAVSATNLQRVLTRRGVLEPTGELAPPGPHGGRPAALFRFTDACLRVTDEFAVLRPPGK